MALWYAFVLQETYQIVYPLLLYNYSPAKIFEGWSQVVSKNKEVFHINKTYLYYNDSTLWEASLEQGVINVAK